MGLRSKLRNAVHKVIKSNQQNAAVAGGVTSPEISISIEHDDDSIVQTPTTARSVNASSDAGQPQSGRGTARSRDTNRPTAAIEAGKSSKFGRRRSRSARPRGSGKSLASLSPNKSQQSAQQDANAGANNNRTNLRVEIPPRAAGARASMDSGSTAGEMRKVSSCEPLDDVSSVSVLTARSNASTCSAYSPRPAVSPAVSAVSASSSRSQRSTTVTTARLAQQQQQSSQAHNAESIPPPSARGTPTTTKSMTRDRGGSVVAAHQRSSTTRHAVSPPPKKASGAAAAALPTPATLKPRTPRADTDAVIEAKNSITKTVQNSKSISHPTTKTPTKARHQHDDRVSPRVAPSSSRSATTSCPPQAHHHHHQAGSINGGGGVNPSVHPRSGLISRAQTQVVTCTNAFDADEDDNDAYACDDGDEDLMMSDDDGCDTDGLRHAAEEPIFRKRAVSEDSSVFSACTSVDAATVEKEKLREQRKEKTKKRMAAARAFTADLVVSTVSAVIGAVL